MEAVVAGLGAFDKGKFSDGYGVPVGTCQLLIANLWYYAMTEMMMNVWYENNIKLFLSPDVACAKCNKTVIKSFSLCICSIT